MVVAGMPILETPALRGNPFDMRPIERSRSHEIVARDDILMEYREHIHSSSPRMKFIIGEQGSGKSSLINVISSFTDRFYVGQYWHEEEVLKKVLTEILVTFGGYEVPRTMNLLIDKLVEILESENGPLPLIALDYPSSVPISNFLSLICPILQRLRAFIIISLNLSQLKELDESVIKIFDTPFELKPLNNNEIQELCDKRIRKVANERWKLSPILLDSIHSISGGNAGSVIKTLRDLIDEKRGLGCVGTYQRTISWSNRKISPTQEEKNIDSSSYKEKISSQEKSELIEPESEHEIFTNEFSDSDLTKFKKYISHTTEKENHLNLDVNSISKTQPEEDEEERILRLNIEDEDNLKITEWTKNQTFFQPNNEKTINQKPSQKGFSGLMNRSRNVSRDMPLGDPENIPVTDSEFFASTEKIIEKIPPQNPIIPEKNSNFNPIKNYPIEKEIDDKNVFSSEGEQWTVDSEFEETLPNIPEEINIFEDEIIESENREILDEPESTNVPIMINPNNDKQIDYNHLGNLTEAEELILEIAESREISPSDPEIQARLEVGRPRLSQLYNSLYKSGILSVRKKGRTRFFKLTENAVEYLSKE